MWSSIFRNEAKSWIFSKLGSNHQLSEVGKIVANSTYIQVNLKSMRIPFARNGFNRFFGAVHSYLSIPHRSQIAPLEVNRIIIPNQLKNIDTVNIDHVINFNQPLLGPIPYRGGNLDLQVGLFSIKSADLTAPFLDLLESLSRATGLSYFSAAQPFVQPLKAAIALLTGSQQSATLEIGLSATFQDPTSGYYVVIGANKGQLDVNDVSVNQSDFSLKFPGNQNYPYMVLEFKGSSEHPTWFQIPELNKAYKMLDDVVRKGSYNEAEELLATFARTAILCDDLLREDGVRLAKLVRDQTALVLGTTQVSLNDFASLPNIEEVPLF